MLEQLGVDVGVAMGLEPAVAVHEGVGTGMQLGVAEGVALGPELAVGANEGVGVRLQLGVHVGSDWDWQ